MTLAAKVVDALHLVALAAWIAALGAAGAAAMGVFGTLPRIGIVMPEYEAWAASQAAVGASDSAAAYGRLAGGMVMAPIFAATDRVQLVAGLVAVLTCAAQLALWPRRWPRRRPSNLLRALCLLFAAALVGYHAAVMAPRMAGNLTAFWESARANQPDAVERRAAFEADHHTANALFRLRLALVTAALALTAVAAVPSARDRCGEGGIEPQTSA